MELIWTFCLSGQNNRTVKAIHHGGNGVRYDRGEGGEERRPTKPEWKFPGGVENPDEGKQGEGNKRGETHGGSIA